MVNYKLNNLVISNTETEFQAPSFHTITSVLRRMKYWQAFLLISSLNLFSHQAHCMAVSLKVLARPTMIFIFIMASRAGFPRGFVIKRRVRIF